MKRVTRKTQRVNNNKGRGNFMLELLNICLDLLPLMIHFDKETSFVVSIHHIARLLFIINYRLSFWYLLASYLSFIFRISIWFIKKMFVDWKRLTSKRKRKKTSTKLSVFRFCLLFVGSKFTFPSKPMKGSGEDMNFWCCYFYCFVVFVTFMQIEKKQANCNFASVLKRQSWISQEFFWVSKQCENF